MSKTNKTILIFFGPPGSGKGTQAEMISKKFKLPTISTGELLRKEVRTKTILGKKVEKIIAQGKYAPDSVIVDIILKRTKNKDAKNGYIFDGFPRNKKQLDYLMKNLNLKDAKILAILINVDDKEVKSRLGERRICSCGETYHIKFNPPKKKGICSLCDSKLYVRDDDKPSVISNRLKIYHKEIEPILDYWDKNDKLIKINGKQSIKKVHQDIIKKLKEHKT